MLPLHRTSQDTGSLPSVLRASADTKAIAMGSVPVSYTHLRALTRLGLRPYLKTILTTTEIGESKHAPTIYHRAAVALGTVPVSYTHLMLRA